MADWKDASNLMKKDNKKAKTKRGKDIRIGLRCWECGQYLDNLKAGHFCTKCLVKQLQKYSLLPPELDLDSKEKSSRKGNKGRKKK